MVDVDVQHVMYNPNQTDKYKESKRDRLRRKEVASLLLNLSHLTAASIQPLYFLPQRAYYALWGRKYKG